MHPNEIKLVFLGTSGAVLPTRDFINLDAAFPATHRAVLREQAQRQREALEAAQPEAVAA